MSRMFSTITISSCNHLCAELFEKIRMNPMYLLFNYFCLILYNFFYYFQFFIFFFTHLWCFEFVYNAFLYIINLIHDSYVLYIPSSYANLYVHNVQTYRHICHEVITPVSFQIDLRDNVYLNNCFFFFSAKGLLLSNCLYQYLNLPFRQFRNLSFHVEVDLLLR